MKGHTVRFPHGGFDDLMTYLRMALHVVVCFRSIVPGKPSSITGEAFKPQECGFMVVTSVLENIKKMSLSCHGVVVVVIQSCHATSEVATHPSR